MTFKALVTASVLLTATALSGCATTPGHRCPLDHGLGCHSLPQAYRAATQPGGNQQSVFGIPRTEPQTAAPAGAVIGESAGYPEAGPGGTPVWTPGRVYRAWTAPWTDAEGYLHSGGYVYFNTPGHWSYGSLDAAGSASGVLAPVKPSQLGFRPGSGLPKQEGATVVGATKAAMAQINGTGGITQPAEQITQ